MTIKSQSKKSKFVKKPLDFGYFIDVFSISAANRIEILRRNEI